MDMPPPPDAPPDAASPDLDGGANGHTNSGANGNGRTNGKGRGGGRTGFDRVPPHSLEAEVSVLGASLLSRNAASEVLELLKPEDFYRTGHRVVFEAIADLMHRGDPVDEVTVLDWLTSTGRLEQIGGPAALVDLTASVPTAANAVHYARIVREKALLRRLIEAGTNVVQMGYEPTDDAQGTIDRAESLIYEVAETGTTNDYAILRELLDESFERIEKLADNRSEVTGLPTGFDDLDRLTAGLQRQNLVIVAARPAMGKSSLTTTMAHYITVKAQQPVAMFNLEMSRMEIVQRLLSIEAGIPTTKLRTGQLDDTDWRRLGDALGTLSNAPMFIDDTPSISLMEIRAKCRRIKQRFGLELVILDYLQLMTSHKRVDSRQVEVAEFSRGLKMLAKELDVPVIALSQLSRQPESRTDKRPLLSDLRESGSIEQDADIVSFIYRDEVYDEESPDKGIAELIVAKHRNGPTGTVKLAFLGHLTKFANLARGGYSGGGGAGSPTPV